MDSTTLGAIRPVMLTSCIFCYERGAGSKWCVTAQGNFTTGCKRLASHFSFQTNSGCTPLRYNLHTSHYQHYRS